MLISGFPFFELLFIDIVIYFVLLILAQLLAPKIASRIAGKIGLYTGMILCAFSIISIFLIMCYILIKYIIYFEIDKSYIVYLLIFILVINILQYIFSPIIINSSFSARHDESLQELVNEVSQKLGIKHPPKAMIVNCPPNAFAYGNIIFGRYVAVSQELINLVDKEELKAIIGHELGHHKHKDNIIIFALGLLPMIIYYLSRSLIIAALYTKNSPRDEDRSSGIALLIGIVGMVVSFILQLFILTFNRLREYYADIEGARASTKINMQSALAKLHLFYKNNIEAFSKLSNSKIKALYIYALVDACASPFINSDKYLIIEKVKNEKVSLISEIFSTHPPIPKRIKALEEVK